MPDNGRLVKQDALQYVSRFPPDSREKQTEEGASFCFAMRLCGIKVNLPGKTQAVKESLRYLLPELAHAVEVIQKED